MYRVCDRIQVPLVERGKRERKERARERGLGEREEMRERWRERGEREGGKRE
jgi:hypothetical protein